MKPDNLLDELIISIYGDPPPPKRANVEEAINLAANELLKGIVEEYEVRTKAEELNAGPIPYSTHDLALSVSLYFFKEQSYGTQLKTASLLARMTVLQWNEKGLVAPFLVKSFEETLYNQGKLNNSSTFTPLSSDATGPNGTYTVSPTTEGDGTGAVLDVTVFSSSIIEFAGIGISIPFLSPNKDVCLLSFSSEL